MKIVWTEATETNLHYYYYKLIIKPLTGPNIPGINHKQDIQYTKHQQEQWINQPLGGMCHPAPWADLKKRKEKQHTCGKQVAEKVVTLHHLLLPPRQSDAVRHALVCLHTYICLIPSHLNLRALGINRPAEASISPLFCVPTVLICHEKLPLYYIYTDASTDPVLISPAHCSPQRHFHARRPRGGKRVISMLIHEPVVLP